MPLEEALKISAEKIRTEIRSESGHLGDGGHPILHRSILQPLGFLFIKKVLKKLSPLKSYSILKLGHFRVDT